jgi:hypothetical protein
LKKAEERKRADDASLADELRRQQSELERVEAQMHRIESEPIMQVAIMPEEEKAKAALVNQVQKNKKQYEEYQKEQAKKIDQLKYAKQDSKMQAEKKHIATIPKKDEVLPIGTQSKAKPIGDVITDTAVGSKPVLDSEELRILEKLQRVDERKRLREEKQREKEEELRQIEQERSKRRQNSERKPTNVEKGKSVGPSEPIGQSLPANAKSQPNQGKSAPPSKKMQESQKPIMEISSKVPKLNLESKPQTQQPTETLPNAAEIP